MAAHRVAAVVLPELLVELARRGATASATPLGVILLDAHGGPSAQSPSSQGPGGDGGGARLDAVNARARALGVAPGQRVSEACALSGELELAYVEARAVGEALATVAEIALGFGATTALALDGGVAPGDVVWVDVSGAAPLFGGEDALAQELSRRVHDAGYAARVAIARGPCLAELCARGGVGEGALEALPVASLFSLVGGAAPRAAALFSKLGVARLGDLVRLERAPLLARLEAALRLADGRVNGGGASALRAKRRARSQGGIGARELLGWLDGVDGRALSPYVPPRELREVASFDDGVASAMQLLFALRGMVSRVAARLAGRAEAANQLELGIALDRGVLAARRGVRRVADADARLLLTIELPAPLAREGDLLRALKAKLESLELEAPATEVELRASRIVEAPRVQLDLSRDDAVHPDALPALLSELSAELGPERVGVLAVVDHHLPERRTALLPALEAARARGSAQLSFATSPHLLAAPSRVFADPRPVVVGPGAEGRGALLARGALLELDGLGFECRGPSFDRRLDGLGWWTAQPSSRDLFRVRLVALHDTRRDDGAMAAAEAWLGVDRVDGSVVLVGFGE